MKKILFVLLFALAVLIQYQTSEAKDMKEWTFLVFMNGHNSLDQFVDSNLASMQQVGSTDDINIVAQAASEERTQTERIYVEKGGHKIIQKLPRVDMGDYRELKKFIEWAVVNYPAKKYFIDVWNHGSGWHSIRTLSNAGDIGGFAPQDVSFDDISNNFITTEQMGDVMKYFAGLIGHKVDLYGNDACLMSMIEVAAELTDSVSYFAGSQDNEPGEGWPYAKLLQRWSEKPEVNGGEVGSILTEEYQKKYQYDQGVTFSTIDLSKLDALMEAIGNLRNELMGLGAEQRASLKMVASATYSFYHSDYKDLLDFILSLEKETTFKVNKSTLMDVKKAFKNAVIKNKVSESSKRAHGLSMWIPTYAPQYDKHISRYENLAFNKKTDWSDLLHNFYRN